MNICLSFDDGRSDSFSTAFQLLSVFDLKGSFHIATGFIDGSLVTDAFGLQRQPIAKDDLLLMHNSGMDISSHGDQHQMETRDFSLSVQKLSSWGIQKKKIGFSVPNSSYTQDALNVFVKANGDKLSYVRVGRHPNCYSLRGKLNYVLYHLFHCYRAFRAFNKHNVIFDVNPFSIYSIVIKRDTKLSDLIRFISEYVAADGTVVLMFHSIVGNPKDEWEWREKDFNDLCVFLAENKNKIRVLTLDELVAND